MTNTAWKNIKKQVNGNRTFAVISEDEDDKFKTYSVISRYTEGRENWYKVLSVYVPKCPAYVTEKYTVDLSRDLDSLRYLVEEA